MRNKILHYPPGLRQRARRLRRDSTHGEKLLWQLIRRRTILGFQFHRQVPMLTYLVDFYCHELMLAIEVDGGSHNTIEAQEYDRHRQQRLEGLGVKFLRFEDVRMRRDIDNVVQEIKAWVKGQGVTPLCPPRGKESKEKQEREEQLR